MAGSPNVNVNGRPAIRVDDPGIHTACCGGNTWNAQTGSKSVFINGKPAHRLGDVVRHCGGVGKCIEGSGNVIVGDLTTGMPKETTVSQKKIAFQVLTLRGGIALKNVEYELLNQGGAVIARGLTGEDGIIEHKPLPPGEYCVRLLGGWSIQDE